MMNANSKLSKSDLGKIHTRMLHILDEVIIILNRNNIEYWLDGGTLLGAVRHNGFIPWDDDIDIGMERKDYNKFIKIAKKELPSDLFLQTKETDPFYKNEYAKIRDNNSKIIESVEESDVKYHQGIFLDIFPFDSVKERKISTYNFLKHLFIRIQNVNKQQKIAYRIINSIGSILFLFFNKSNLRNKIRDNFRSSEDGDFIVYAYEVPFTKFIHHRDIYPLKEIEYCNRKCFTPSNYDAYLTFAYNDYMTIPKESDRFTHSISVEFYK